MASHCNELLARAQTVMPGGVNSPVRSFRGVGGNPLIFKQGTGPYLVDTADRQYVDYVGSWGPLILGHAHPNVTAAIHQAVDNGLTFGATTPLEIEVAELITRLMPSIQKIRMVSSGTEATQSAIRLARGFTGRSKILKFEGCYHGHSDGLLVKAGSGLLTFGIPDSPGVPDAIAEHTLTVPYNDLKSTQLVFEHFGSDIAAVIVEPIAGNMSCVLPIPSFLTGLRALCSQYQSLLIFDEVITGFRVHLGGAQALYSITPDITCLGKIIGGGLPVGAFGGKQEIMDHLAPIGPVYQAGTLSGNPIALTAGFATLKELQKEGVYERLEEKTNFLIQNLSSLAKHHSIPFTTHRKGSLFGLFFSEGTPILSYTDVTHSNQTQFKQFFHGMLKEGVYFAPSAFESGFVSLAHSQSVLDYTLEAAERVFKSWSEKH